MCRPLSGAVSSQNLQVFVGTGLSLQLCRPLSGAVRPSFQRACMARVALQLCRPLSGAVSPPAGLAAGAADGSFNCAAPFRGRLGGRRDCRPALRWICFNCAAPFRGRLDGIPVPRPRCPLGFNCAAPFRGRLVVICSIIAAHSSALQLCRPLSGAVSLIGLSNSPCQGRFAPFYAVLATDFVSRHLVPP